MVMLQKWTDLPDPRNPDEGQTLIVLFTARNWEHCCKHWLNREEPWKEEFGADAIAELRKGVPASTPLPPVVERVLAVLYRQTRDCLERPQAIVCRAVVEKPNGKSQGRKKLVKWILVLPSGAMTILSGRGDTYRWVTCYFPAEKAVNKNRRYRWQATVRRLIRLYVLLPGNLSSVTLPDKHVEVIRRDARGKILERLREMTFLTPETWGFCGDLPGSPWRGRLPSWPAAEPPEEKPAKKRRIKPRVRLEDDDWDD